MTLSCYNGQSKTYTVMGIVQDVQIGSSSHFFILPEEELSVLYPEISDFTGYVNLHTEQDSDQLRRAVFGAVSDQRVVISGLDDLSAELERGLQGELARDYGILVFIFVFSLINLANTLITNLLTRQQEFGVFQSVGMSDRQLSNMLSFECLYYVGITLLVTLTLGTACSLVVCRGIRSDRPVRDAHLPFPGAPGVALRRRAASGAGGCSPPARSAIPEDCLLWSGLRRRIKEVFNMTWPFENDTSGVHP